MKWTFLVWLCLLILAGCGELELGIETTPTANTAATATVAALVTRNTELNATIEALSPAPELTTTLALIYEQDGTLYRGSFDGSSAQPVGVLPVALQTAFEQADAVTLLGALHINGQLLAYGAQGTIGLINLTTGITTPLYTSTQQEFLGIGVHQVLWSSDGQALVYAITYKDPSGPPVNAWATEAGVIDLVSGTQRTITTSHSVGRGFSLISYDVVADRLWLVSHGGDPTVGELLAYQVSQATAEPERYPIRGEGRPAGSTEYLAVAGVHESDDVPGHIAQTLIYDLHAPTAEPQILQHPSGTYGAHYLWHKDQLAYLLGHGLSWQETTDTAEGIFGWQPHAEEAYKLAPASLPDNGPLAWSPDGSWLLSVDSAGEYRRYLAAPRQSTDVVILKVPATATVLGWT